MMMKKMFVQIAVFCLLATIAAVSGHEGHVHSPAPAPGPATNSAVVPTTNMFTGLAFAAVALVLGETDEDNERKPNTRERPELEVSYTRKVRSSSFIHQDEITLPTNPR
ncbi:hypothetical protein YC2023_045767 [Brassica napus]